MSLALLVLVAAGVGQFVNDMIPSLKLAHPSLGYALPTHTPNPFKRSHADMNRLVLFNRYFAKTDGARRGHLVFCICAKCNQRHRSNESARSFFCAQILRSIKVMSSELSLLLVQASKPHKRCLFFRSLQVSLRSVRLLNEVQLLASMCAGRWGEPLFWVSLAGSLTMVKACHQERRVESARDLGLRTVCQTQGAHRLLPCRTVNGDRSTKIIDH
jgi:hypothetical protein